MLTQEQDEFHWDLDPKGQLSVKSHYSALIHLDISNLNNIIWKIKTPLKVKKFSLVPSEGILTKDNLAKHNWQHSQKHCFYHKNETIKHLF